MQKTHRQLITGFGAGLLFILAFAIFFFLTSKTVIVRGQSMLPTFKDGQRVFVNNAYYLLGGLKDGDVVVIREDSPLNKDGYIIKRIYKMAGEEVDYLNLPRTQKFAEGATLKIQSGFIYVLGDNRNASEDSRVFGPVEVNRVLGKVIRFK